MRDFFLAEKHVTLRDFFMLRNFLHVKRSFFMLRNMFTLRDIFTQRDFFQADIPFYTERFFSCCKPVSC